MLGQIYEGLEADISMKIDKYNIHIKQFNYPLSFQQQTKRYTLKVIVKIAICTWCIVWFSLWWCLNNGKTEMPNIRISTAAKMPR